MEKIILVAGRDGTLRFIHNDRLMGLARHGQTTISRASHVEPGDSAKGQDPLKWYADLCPVGGPVLGGFDTRQKALDEEVSWLNSHNLGRQSAAVA